MDDEDIAAAIIEQSQNAFELMKLLNKDLQSEVIEALYESLAVYEGLIR